MHKIVVHMRVEMMACYNQNGSGEATNLGVEPDGVIDFLQAMHTFYLDSIRGNSIEGSAWS